MRSISLDIKQISYFGWYDSKSAGPGVSFFRPGSTMASFCEDGNRPCSNDPLIVFVIADIKALVNCFTNHGGTGSMLHWLLDAARITVGTSPAVNSSSEWWNNSVTNVGFRRIHGCDSNLVCNHCENCTP